jgi:hypothetical protein
VASLATRTVAMRLGPLVAGLAARTVAMRLGQRDVRAGLAPGGQPDVALRWRGHKGFKDHNNKPKNMRWWGPMWDHVLVGPTCGTMRWWGPHVGPCADGSYMWDQVLVGPCVGWTRTHNYTWLHVGPDPCFLFFKLFCDDNIVAL